MIEENATWQANAVDSVQITLKPGEKLQSVESVTKWSDRRVIGQMWCNPTYVSGSESGPYSGCVAIESNHGLLLLCDVVVEETFKGSDLVSSKTKYLPVSSKTIPRIDAHGDRV